MKALKSAIVGCGGIAQVHARALRDIPEAELTAAADIRPERSEALCKEYGGTAYPSLEEMLDREEIQVLHICTPHYLHLPMAKEAARRGIHVFTEKPPVMDRAGWQDFQTLSQAPVRVGICFQNRYNPSVKRCREILASGKAGKILGARAFVTWKREAPYYTESGWRGTLATEGGGVLINQSIHTLDLMSQFLGRGQVLGASLDNRHLRGVVQVEDVLEAAIDFQGARGLFYATTAYCTDAPILLELVCEHMTLRIEGEVLTQTMEDGSRTQEDLTLRGTVPGKEYWGSSHHRCIEDFYRCIGEDRAFPNDIPGVRDTVELMLDIYDSAREN